MTLIPFQIDREKLLWVVYRFCQQQCQPAHKTVVMTVISEAELNCVYEFLGAGDGAYQERGH